jgi:hypothetical protein
MSMTFIGTLLGFLSSMLSGLVLMVIHNGQKKSKQREETRDRTHLLELKFLKANASVLEQLTRCVKGEKPNGELDAAYKYLCEIKHEFNDQLLKNGHN